MTWSDAFSWTYWVSTIGGGTHFGAALLALVLGPVLFFRRKATRFHRQFGYIFVLCMLVVNITALTQYDFTGRPNLFHFFALMSLSALLPGFYFLQRAVRLKREDLLALHARLMMWSYLGLALAGVAQVLTRIIPMYVDDIGRGYMIMGVGFLLACGIASLVFSRAATGLARRYPFGP